MRAAVRTAIINDATLQGLGLTADAVYAGDVDTPEERPFVVLRWGDTTTGLSTVDSRALTIFVQDEPNDYELVDAIIRRIRTVLTSLGGTEHETGWFVQVDWAGDSGDLADDVHGTIQRQSRYTLITSGN